MKSTKKFVLVPYEKYERMTVNKYAKQPTIADDEGNRRLDEEAIIQQIPHPLRSKARDVLKEIVNAGQLDWNENGELTSTSENIHYSNIADLIKSKVTREPQSGLASASELPDQVSDNNSTGRYKFEQSGEGEHYPLHPPPGLPNKKRNRSLVKDERQKIKKIKTKKHNWQELWQTHV